MSQLAKAIALAATEFQNKLDKGGKPYILHCLRVMNNLNSDDEELNCIAVLHDLIEDTKYTTYDLFTLGFSERIVSGVNCLTKTSGMTYDEYIRRISLDVDAVKVKLADLKDNSDITRLKGLSKKDFDRMEKYHKAFVYLSNI